MNRPKGLALTAILMAFCNAMLWATIKPGRPPYSLRMLGMFTVFICIGCVVIWFYWKGRNWARIAVLLFSGFSLFNLLNWNRVSLSPALLTTPTHIMMAARAVLGVALLYWLNTRPVLEFFYPENRQSPPRLGWGRILAGLWTISSGVQNLYYPAPNLRRVANEAQAVGMLMFFIGACLIAWGIRARTLPYHSAFRENRS